METTPLPQRIFGPVPFARLASTHTLSASADAFFAVSLAGSLFFNVSVGAARPRIILYLALTMAPFAIVAPLIGPLVDRFGRARGRVIALSMLARGVLCVFIAGDLKDLLFYPEVFGVLVLGKGYSVAKSAAVPGLIEGPGGLVAANSRLSRLASIAALGAGALAAGILTLSGAPMVLRLAALVYFIAAALALRIPSVVEPPPAPQVEQAELHSPSVVLGASALTVLRAGIGFLTFLLAFGFRRSGEPVWLYGAILAAVGIGYFAATVVSPALKRHWLREEQLLAAALLVTGAAALACALRFSHASLIVAGFAIGLGTNGGRLAFDSVLQRDAPHAARGRSFARFETRFQLAWIVGALVPVVFPMDTRAGLVALGVTLTLALTAYLAGVSIENRMSRGFRRVFGRGG